MASSTPPPHQEVDQDQAAADLDHDQAAADRDQDQVAAVPFLSLLSHRRHQVRQRPQSAQFIRPSRRV